MWLFTLILLIAIFHENFSANSGHLEFPLNAIPIGLKSVSCAGGNSSCPAIETCCQLASGRDACCPLPEAVCCNDHLHCCPHGYACDVEHSRCQKIFEHPICQKFEQLSRVVCPGSISIHSTSPDQMSCAAGETCLKSQTGGYDCCPLPNAVRCDDSIHCCPNGYRCDIDRKKCEKGISIPWFEKKAAMLLDLSPKLILAATFSSTPSTIQCFDEKSFCPEDTSCCEVRNSSYGCCPYRQGSCCSDKIHCCAKGYSCDQSGSRCIRHLSLIPLLILEEEICPDRITKCASTSTCCPNKNDDPISYSCCLYAGGMCCGSNGSSCCPHNHVCDENHLMCQFNQTISMGNETLTQDGSSNDVDTPTEYCHKTHPTHFSLWELCRSGESCGAGKICCNSTACCLPGHCDPASRQCL